MMRDHTVTILSVVLAAMLLLLPLLPNWVTDLSMISLCYGIVVLGMMLLMRTGLVSEGIP